MIANPPDPNEFPEWLSRHVPETQKVAAKRAAQKTCASLAERMAVEMAARVAGTTAVKAGTKAVAKTGTKIAVKSGTKIAAKTALRTAANPWLLASDVLELGAQAACDGLDIDDDVASVITKSVGISSSVAIGACIAGPIGAAVGAVLWGFGELVGCMFGH